ncbi:MAG: hypothetical protein V1853_00050 [bacterium]
MDKNTKLIILGLTIVVIAAFVLYPLLPRRIGSNSDSKGIRIVRDSVDLYVYYVRSRWVPEQQMPYRDTFIEYPQLAMLYMAWPMLFVNNFDSYEVLIVITNILAFGVLILISRKLLLALYRSTKILWLLALPSIIYFTLYRFDVWPALAVTASLYCVFKKKNAWALLLLASAIFFKWYAVILIPLYWHWLRQNEAKPGETKKLFIALILIGAITLSIMYVLFEDGFINTYRQHLLARVFEPASIFYLIKGEDFIIDGIRNTVLLLQIALTLVWLGIGKYLRKKWSDFDSLIGWSAVLIMIFIFFAKFYSPQWLIWYVPLLLLLPLSHRLIWAIVLNDILNYAYFPILFDSAGSASIITLSLVVIRTIVFAYLIYLVARWLLRKRINPQLSI